MSPLKKLDTAMRSTFFITVHKNKVLIIEEDAHKKPAQLPHHTIITINEFTNTDNVNFHFLYKPN